MKSLGLYLHIPFCKHRCAYCDFNAYSGLEYLTTAYVEALCAEVDYIAASSEDRLSIQTIFFGGGTPSLLPAHQLETILSRIEAQFELGPGLEITLEANPGTLNQAYLKDIFILGINRLSLGMQSANKAELQMLERVHNHLDVVNSVIWARRAGFENISLDLMYGLPDQNLESWLKSLNLALEIEPDHFSLYALTLEHGTPMQAWVARGLMNEPDPDLAAEMYELAGELMESHGYHQYEISNWAKWEEGKGLLSCRHNLQYWRNLPYLGLGAGAHGYANKLRVANVLSPTKYIKRLANPPDIGKTPKSLQIFPKTPATANVTPIDTETERAETMLMGLRLTQEGVSQTTFFDRFGVGLDEVYSIEINSLIQQGLLEWQGDNLRLTKPGRLLGNQVFVQFI